MSVRQKLDIRVKRLDDAIRLSTDSPSVTRIAKLPRLLDSARQVLMIEGGCEVIEARAAAIEAAGVFEGTDWANPQILMPSLTTGSLRSPQMEVVVIEALSELRLLAVANGHYQPHSISSEQAHHYLTQVLAINLEMLFSTPNEAEREQQGKLAMVSRHVIRHLAEGIGYEHVIDQLIDEIWRILRQRPIQLADVRRMITQIAVCRANPDLELGGSGQGADRLISSLFGPTQACREDPGIAVYLERLEAMDNVALQGEATGCARAMHDTGLVSPYHAALVRYLLDDNSVLLPEALGLSGTGRDCLYCYQNLVHALIRDALYPETCQGLYGLALLLERGILYQTAVAPALWRQLKLPLSDVAADRLQLVFGPTPSPRAWLVQGVLSMLGQPLGVGQGNNPTCQSARALSMWAYNDPDYLLQMVAWAARDDEIVMHFEGQPVSSRDSGAGVAATIALDLDPVSLIVVPHLDRIYAEMGRLCIGREGDPHRWVNPEFHGWWSGRGFRINVDVATGHLEDLDGFLRHFYVSYHPYYNGSQPLIHPQPAGVAVTDSAARFIGWHAITVLRVGLDQQDVMRVYFFNPNNDSGQNWGDGIVVSTSGNGERFGEASLPFEEFASRLYIFHFDPLEKGNPEKVPQEDLDRITEKVHQSWGADRVPALALQADPGAF
ncbi:hypothetical protein [uncultured Marinobacter sp.]|uniref:hypothetical protein n=1 Tax=uncultured Marinobacter sp. TaxID=187379 RepID=UPI0030D8A2E2